MQHSSAGSCTAAPPHRRLVRLHQRAVALAPAVPHDVAAVDRDAFFGKAREHCGRRRGVEMRRGDGAAGEPWLASTCCCCCCCRRIPMQEAFLDRASAPGCGCSCCCREHHFRCTLTLFVAAHVLGQAVVEAEQRLWRAGGGVWKVGHLEELVAGGRHALALQVLQQHRREEEEKGCGVGLRRRSSRHEEPTSNRRQPTAATGSLPAPWRLLWASGCAGGWVWQQCGAGQLHGGQRGSDGGKRVVGKRVVGRRRRQPAASSQERTRADARPSAVKTPCRADEGVPAPT